VNVDVVDDPSMGDAEPTMILKIAWGTSVTLPSW